MNCFLHIVSALTLLASATDARADAVTQREDQFKAAYVFNFVKFVDWPEGVAADTVTICFAGGEGVYKALTTGIDRKRVGARRLATLQIAEPSATGGCNALYIDAAMATSYTFASEPAVLTISDAAKFAERGGMIQLFTENHRLRFLVNVDSAQRAGLRISSDLLKLAAGVQREPR
ncbi:MAG TPA: YfiR family protein [Steroidobacter sp.]|uniref:YfiR family protein n=1 Tax=Steroidobacter sp. TaxID=1978227 RepID=UPI002EDA09DD